MAAILFVARVDFGDRSPPIFYEGACDDSRNIASATTPRPGRAGVAPLQRPRGRFRRRRSTLASSSPGWESACNRPGPDLLPLLIPLDPSGAVGRVVKTRPASYMIASCTPDPGVRAPSGRNRFTRFCRRDGEHRLRNPAVESPFPLDVGAGETPATTSIAPRVSPCARPVDGRHHPLLGLRVGAAGFRVRARIARREGARTPYDPLEPTAGHGCRCGCVAPKDSRAGLPPPGCVSRTRARGMSARRTSGI